jgi:DNA-binding NarL/FixJ family response regulator
VSLIRILLADDNDEVLAEIRREFGDEFEIVGTAANGQDAVDAVLRFEPDIAVLDNYARYGWYSGLLADSRGKCTDESCFSDDPGKSRIYFCSVLCRGFRLRHKATAVNGPSSRNPRSG